MEMEWNGFKAGVGKKKVPFANTGSVGFRFEFFTNYDNTKRQVTNEGIISSEIDTYKYIG